jgi:hypothetical protein
MSWLRTWLRVTASLAGLAAGAAIDGGAAAEEEQRDPEAPSNLESAGSSASGPSFYVWDEDPREARRWAADLSRWPELKDDDFG